VFYERDASCGARIDFLWGAGFPLKHVVRRYATSATWIKVDDCIRSWRNIEPMAPNWYELTD